MAERYRTGSTPSFKEPRRKKGHLKASFLTWRCLAMRGTAVLGLAWRGVARQGKREEVHR